MSLREEQCQKVCRILDDVLANRPTERDSLIVATRNAFSALSEQPEIIRDEHCPLIDIPTPHGRLIDADKLANKTFYSKTSAPYITYKKFVDAPTVIEAEGET